MPIATLVPFIFYLVVVLAVGLRGTGKQTAATPLRSYGADEGQA